MVVISIICMNVITPPACGRLVGRTNRTYQRRPGVWCAVGAEVPSASSACPAQQREEAALCARVCGDRYLGTDGTGGTERVQLRLDDLPAGLHQVRVERVVLPAGHGKVPAVDQDIEEAVPGINHSGTGP